MNFGDRIFLIHTSLRKRRRGCVMSTLVGLGRLGCRIVHGKLRKTASKAKSLRRLITEELRWRFFETVSSISSEVGVFAAKKTPTVGPAIHVAIFAIFFGAFVAISFSAVRGSATWKMVRLLCVGGVAAVTGDIRLSETQGAIWMDCANCRRLRIHVISTVCEMTVKVGRCTFVHELTVVVIGASMQSIERALSPLLAG